MQSNPDNTSTMNHVLHCSTTFNLTKNDIIILRVSGSTATAGTISNAFPLTDKMNSFSGFIIR
jgi:CMP-N-acetylneuraminic acid synthetase